MVACTSTRSLAKNHQSETHPARFFFTTQGKTAMMNADGSGLRYFEFDEPNQATWQPSDFFSDGRRVLFLSMEPRLDGPGKPFNEYYHKTPTHIWIYDLDSGSLTEIATKNRMAPFYTPQILINDERILMQVVCNKVAQTFSMNLDGSDPQEFTRAGEGMPYGMNLNPDGKRVAYHIAASTYQIWTSDIDGSNRTLVASHPDHLYFCPEWSPDSQWLVFQDCQFRQDPGHDWSDLCLSRPDGSEQRLLTKNQSLWFAATYGYPGNRSGGSNVPAWTHDGEILCSHRLPDSRVAWEYQANRPDVDHFNRDYKPELACGGTEICRIDPRDDSITKITHSNPPMWDFRQSESHNGKQILFCRANTGESPAIWVANSDGRNLRMLTKGLNDLGADHPRWIPPFSL
ncbi:MAG: serine/threonine protein kinase [Planctomycetes bacterium]|nr:serine/threonine protein kinase [Planctomycetota bacterium]